VPTKILPIKRYLENSSSNMAATYLLHYKLEHL
jgi:hypothetical protein